MKFVHLVRMLAVCGVLIPFGTCPVYSADKTECLRYEFTWNGSKAGHGDVTTVQEANRTKVTAQAVSDGMVKKIVELWTRIQASFLRSSFTPESYNFHLKSNLSHPEMVDLSFDHSKSLVQINKQKGSERESHAEKFSGLYDPITAVFLLRSKDLSKPMYVDIFDGKDKSRLFVTYDGAEEITIRTGRHSALRLNLRLVKMTGDHNEIGTGKLWISNDKRRVPLLLTSCPIIGTIRMELVQAQL